MTDASTSDRRDMVSSEWQSSRGVHVHVVSQQYSPGSGADRAEPALDRDDCRLMWLASAASSYQDCILLIVTRFITIGVFGLLPASCGTRAICLTRSSSLHCPKIVCFPLRCSGATSVMKNWLPLVPGPAFAIASVPSCIVRPLFTCLLYTSDAADE